MTAIDIRYYRFSFKTLTQLSSCDLFENLLASTLENVWDTPEIQVKSLFKIGKRIEIKCFPKQTSKCLLLKRTPNVDLKNEICVKLLFMMGHIWTSQTQQDVKIKYDLWLLYQFVDLYEILGQIGQPEVSLYLCL